MVSALPSERVEVAVLVHIDGHQVGERGKRPSHGRLEGVRVGATHLALAPAALAAALAVVGVARSHQVGVGVARA